MNKTCLVILSAFIIARGFAQDYRDPAIWNNLETAIRTKTNLVNALGRVHAMRQEAAAANDCIPLARCFYYEMLIKDQRSEDTLYFKNSAFIDSILLALPANDCLKTLMHALQAKRLMGFRNRSLRFNRARYEIKGQRYNYAAYTSKELDSLVKLHYETALTGINIRPERIDEIRWIYSGPFLFLFRPDLRDLLFAEHISYTTSQYYNSDYKKYIRKWLTLSPELFLRVVDSLSATSGKTAPVFQLYSSWLKKNSDDKTALYFIETKIRQYLYDRNGEDSLTQKAYGKYLERNLGAAKLPIRAHAVYSFCLWLGEESGKFYSYKGYDSSYQLYAVRALQLYEEQKVLLDSFPHFQESLQRMKEQLLFKKLHVEMDSRHLPGEPVTIKAGYKNNEVLYYHVVKVAVGEQIPEGREKVARFLLNHAALLKDTFQLPYAEDHNERSVYLSLRALPTGNYYLLFSDREIRSHDTTLSYIQFGVTGIAVINNDERIFVLDRKTGFPLEGAGVSCFYQEKIRGKKHQQAVRTDKMLTVNKEGFITITDKRTDSLEITYQGDTTTYEFSLGNVDRSKPDEAYDKDDYDGLADYYDTESVLHIYTDRSIYRPGQTVFYKAVFLTRDPKTGKFIIFNKQNLKGSLFTSYFKKWFRKFNPVLYLEDAFHKNVDSVKMIVNEYGSFSGSFVLPRTASTGTWHIEPDYVDTDYRNDGSFKVEEYKRPTFEAKLEKPKDLLLPGDPFTLTIKTKSFSGASLNDIPVRYTLTRTGYLPAYDSQEEKETARYHTEDLVDTVGYTNEKGELGVRVSDSLLSRYKLDNEKQWSFRYELRSVIVDASGETTELKDAVNISSRPVRISFGVRSVVDRKDIAGCKVTTEISNTGAAIGKKVEVRIYKIAGDSNKELLWETVVNTAAFERLMLPKDRLPAGKYELKGLCVEDGKIIGETVRSLSVLDTRTGALPERTDDFSHLAANSVMAGDTISYYHGCSSDSVYAIYELQGYVQKGKRVLLQNTYTLRSLPQGMSNREIVIPKEAAGNMLFTHIFILNNRLYKHQETIYVTRPNRSRPEVIVEKYRSSIMPGAKETFMVSVKTKNEKIAAELMTTMYDATLDKLEEHRWSFPEPEKENGYLRREWSGSLNRQLRMGIVYPELSKQPVGNPLLALQGRVPGLTIVNSSALDEIQVIAYGTTTQRFNTGNVSVRIQGQNSILNYAMPMIVIDGVPYTGDLKDFDKSLITEAVVLKGADASAIWGSRASEGILVISTKGSIQLPEVKQEPLVKVRKNFSETAFFFPAVHADKDGYYRFTFAMPETVTEWKWKMLAHTKDAQSGYNEKKVLTQLPLMVQPNMPRLLYQGDRVVLKSRISNLDSITVEGKITCRIEDAITGADITGKLTGNAENIFMLGKSLTGSAAFTLRVPADQVNPLKILIKASSKQFADAEETIIPVISSRTFVRQAVPFLLYAADTVLRMPALPVDAIVYGIGLSIEPQPRAALINALPWLANYSYNCAEQTFNKLLAHITALKIMRTDSIARRSFRMAKLKLEGVKEADVQLPDEQTAPWLNLANATAQQQKLLFELLDTSRTKANIDAYLDKLYGLQNKDDGGMPWFAGGISNGYISNYLLAGFGKLQQEGWKIDHRQYYNADHYPQLIKGLIDYIDLQFSKNNTLYYCYARSFWKKEHAMKDTLLQQVKNYLSGRWDKVNELSLYDQALLIISINQYFPEQDRMRQKANAQLEAICQLAIKDDVMGIRWKEIADTDEPDNTAEETIVLLSEAFEATAFEKEMHSGIVKWLLNARTEHRWSTTKATAAAIGLLQKEKVSVAGESRMIVSNSGLSVSDDLLSGNSFAFRQIIAPAGEIALTKQGMQPAGAAISWYYFSAMPSPRLPGEGPVISKKLYAYNGQTQRREELTAERTLRMGDKLEVVLTIESSKALRYVYIDDKRAAAFEPLDNSSGYQYGSGFPYYRSVRDAGCQFFADFIPSGKWEISYELRVAQEGSFTNGPAMLQCMYRPEVYAYSNSLLVTSLP